MVRYFITTSVYEWKTDEENYQDSLFDLSCFSLSSGVFSAVLTNTINRKNAIPRAISMSTCDTSARGRKSPEDAGMPAAQLKRENQQQEKKV